MSKQIVCDLFASNGEDIVSLLFSEFKIYTNFYFSMAPIIQARPMLSIAICWPGTILLQPDLP